MSKLYPSESKGNWRTIGKTLLGPIYLILASWLPLNLQV